MVTSLAPDKRPALVLRNFMNAGDKDQVIACFHALFQRAKEGSNCPFQDWNVVPAAEPLDIAKPVLVLSLRKLNGERLLIFAQHIYAERKAGRKITDECGGFVDANQHKRRPEGNGGE